jgi:hypothetical protein
MRLAAHWDLSEFAGTPAGAATARLGALAREGREESTQTLLGHGRKSD